MAPRWRQRILEIFFIFCLVEYFLGIRFYANLRCGESFLSFDHYAGASPLARPQSGSGFAVQDSEEFTVWARCEPHSQVVVPQQISIQVAFNSTASGPTAIATMSALGERRFESRATTPLWGTPQKGWVAFLFEGPPIKGNYYCQTDWGVKHAHLSYVAHPQIKIYLSSDGNPTSTEMDPALQGNRSTVSIPPTAGSITYEAGAGTVAPYWLELAIPVYDAQSTSTTMYNEFR
jgi:hypothetical protein